MKLFMTLTNKDFVSGKRMPWWMGVAWYNDMWQQTIFVIIPLNFPAGWLRHLYWRLVSGVSHHECFCFNLPREQKEFLREILKLHPTLTSEEICNFIRTTQLVYKADLSIEAFGTRETP